MVQLVVPAASAQTPTPDTAVRLAFVGDIMVGRHVGEIIAQQGTRYPFADIAVVLHSADLAFGNIESPLTTAPRVAGGYDLRADPAAAEAVALAGFDLLSVANNHATDNGRPGLLETMRVLADWGMAAVGCGENLESARGPWRTEINGLRLAFFAYEGLRATFQASPTAAGCMWLEPAKAAQAISEARPESDLVVVSVHWGEEYHSLPNARQREIAQQLADAGADIIIGHHPHVVQPIEWVQGRGRPHPTLVAYSLGNFLFDQWFSDETT
ncbi:MAG: CapA family protein, partial [Anaerolineae bacterium]